MQIAIARFFDGEPADPVAESIPQPQDIRRQEVLMNGFSSSPSPSSSRNRNLEPAPRIVPQPENQQLTQPAPLILSLLFAPVNILYSLLSRTFGILGYIFPFLPRLINRISGRTAAGGSRRNTSGRRPLNSRDTAARFIREFEEEYGPNQLPFFESGYAQAFDAAKRDLKFLIVVLLSPEHDDTSSFVRDTLLSTEVATFFESQRDNILLWAGNIQDPEAYQVSTELNCSKFPFSALIVHTPSQSSTAMSTVLRLTGPMPAPTYVSRLQNTINQHSTELDRVRSSRREQQATRNLRQEQESAYERSLAQDRERARRKKEAQEAEQRAEKEALEKEQAAEREANNLEQWRKWRTKSIAAEPGADVKDAVRISLRMPEGERVIRKFKADASMEELYAFVECYDILNSGEEIPADIEEPESWSHEYKFRLVSPMPRQVYDITDGGTIKEKVGRSGNLIVEQILADEDEDEDGEA